MWIPFLYIRLILHLLRASYLYSVGKGYVPSVYHHPRAGTRQGDPLSPALFSLVASFVISPLQDLGPGLTIMMYSDDLIIFLDGQANPQLLRRVWEVVSRFGQFSGLKVNLSKTAAMGNNHRIHTIQRQPSIYPAGHGPNSRTDFPMMVGKGTLQYPAGGPAGGPPGKPGPSAVTALCVLPK